MRRRNIDRYLADSLSHYRPTIDRLSTDHRPTIDRLSTDYRPTVDRYIDRLSTAISTAMSTDISVDITHGKQDPSWKSFGWLKECLKQKPLVTSITLLDSQFFFNSLCICACVSKEEFDSRSGDTGAIIIIHILQLYLKDIIIRCKYFLLFIGWELTRPGLKCLKCLQINHPTLFDYK